MSGKEREPFSVGPEAAAAARVAGIRYPYNPLFKQIDHCANIVQKNILCMPEMDSMLTALKPSLA